VKKPRLFSADSTFNVIATNSTYGRIVEYGLGIDIIMDRNIEDYIR
jgi:hypothetical protein